MVPPSYLVARMKARNACTPISDKLAFCKVDLIGIGIIAFTIFFLLFCLERIVRVVRRTLSQRRSCQPVVQSPTQSEVTLMTDSSTVKQLSDGTKCMPPLHRCLERSESESLYDYNNPPRPSLRQLYSESSSLASVHISRPQLAYTRSDDLLRTIPVSNVSFTGLHTRTMSDCSVDTIFGSPPRASTPPPCTR